MSEPLHSAEELFARVQALELTITLLLIEVARNRPEFASDALSMMDDATPYLADRSVSDFERSLRIRERAQTLLRDLLSEFERAHRARGQPPNTPEPPGQAEPER